MAAKLTRLTHKIAI